MNIEQAIRARWKEQARSCRLHDFDSIVTLATDVLTSPHSTPRMRTTAQLVRSDVDEARGSRASQAVRQRAIESFIALKGELGALWDLI